MHHLGTLDRQVVGTTWGFAWARCDRGADVRKECRFYKGREIRQPNGSGFFGRSKLQRYLNDIEVSSIFSFSMTLVDVMSQSDSASVRFWHVKRADHVTSRNSSFMWCLLIYMGAHMVAAVFISLMFNRHH
jgi:hypothetical protein